MNKRVFSNSIIYIFNQVVIKAFGFFLLPLYTRYLTTADYGTTNLLASFTSVLGFIIVFSLYSAVSRFYVECKHEPEKVKSLFGTLLLFTMVSGFFFLLLALVFNQFLVNVFFQDVPFFPIIFVALLGQIFHSVHQMYTSILRAMQDAKRDFVTNLIFFFLQLFFNIVFVVFFRAGALGIVAATLISNLIFSIYVTIDLRTRNLITFKINPKILKETLKYSIPIIPHNLSTTISQLISRVLINNRFSLSSVGIYSLATQFATLTDTVQSSVNIAVQPWLFAQLHEGTDKELVQVRNMSYLISWLTGIIFLGIAFFSQEAILLLVNPTYKQAWTIVPVLTAAFMIKSMYYPYINLLFYVKSASRRIFIATLSSSVINMLLSVILIPVWGAYGSAVADIGAMFIRVGIVVYLVRDIKRVAYQLAYFVRVSVINLLCLFLGLYLSYTKWVYDVSIANICIKLLVLFLYSLLAYRGIKRNIALTFKGLFFRSKQ